MKENFFKFESLYFIMNNKLRKKVKLEYAKQNINFFYNLLDKRFCPSKDFFYIREIKRLAQGFNIRLKREEKLKFCSKCNSYLDINSRSIRINPKTCCIEYKCLNCLNIKRFRYK